MRHEKLHAELLGLTNGAGDGINREQDARHFEVASAGH
jgi:hypothetical protein